MAKQTIVTPGTQQPNRDDMVKADANFTELYTSVGTIEGGTSFTLAEYADNAAAVTGGLEVGDLYTTTGTVKVVTA